MASGQLISSDQFHDLFSRVLGEPEFRSELEKGGVGMLKNYGLAVDMPADIERQLNSIPQLAATSRCGTCGVCGLCSLCGEINLGSGSAFLWATFFLGSESLTASSAA